MKIEPDPTAEQVRRAAPPANGGDQRWQAQLERAFLAGLHRPQGGEAGEPDAASRQPPKPSEPAPATPGRIAVDAPPCPAPGNTIIDAGSGIAPANPAIRVQAVLPSVAFTPFRLSSAARDVAPGACPGEPVPRVAPAGGRDAQASGDAASPTPRDAAPASEARQDAGRYAARHVHVSTPDPQLAVVAVRDAALSEAGAQALATSIARTLHDQGIRAHRVIFNGKTFEPRATPSGGTDSIASTIPRRDAP